MNNILMDATKVGSDEWCNAAFDYLFGDLFPKEMKEVKPQEKVSAGAETEYLQKGRKA